MGHSSDVPDLARIRADLLRIVGEVAGEDVGHIPPDTAILDLVVSSLALVEGMRRIYEHFGVLISIRRVIEGQVTLGGIAVLIEQELRAPRAQRRETAAAAVSPASAPPLRIPFAPSQRHVAFLARYSSEAAAAFNEAVAVGLEGSLDAPALDAALAAVVERYESLRTALSADSDELLVHVRPATQLVVSRIDAAHRDDRLVEVVRRPFAAGERLFRAELLRESDTRHVLVLVSHALVADSEAMALVVEDLASRYSAFADNRDVGAGFPALQWTDYLAMGDAPVIHEARTQAEAFWKNTLSAPFDPLALPADHPRPPVKRYAGRRLTQPLDPDLLVRAEQWGRSRNLSVSEVVLGAYGIQLGRLSGQEALVVGVRSSPLYLDAGEHVVAQTRNIVPVRAVIDPKESFADLVSRVAADMRAAEHHRHLSLAELIALADLPRDQSRSPLFVAAFEHRERRATSAFGTLRTHAVDVTASGARYDVGLALVTGADGAALVCDFSTELFDPETIARWLHGLAALLAAGLEDPQAPCGRLPLMPAAERDTVLVEWNRTEFGYARGRTIFDLFADQARARPEAPAVRFGQDEWSYERLLWRVEALANHLVRSGVRAGDRVGVLLERSPDLVAGLLAVWRAGALYVPLDHRFPAKRLAYMLDDAAVRACLTSRALSARLPDAIGRRAVEVDEVEPRPPGALDGAPAAAEGSAYIIYTSGSTGQPKGVEVTHEGLVNCLQDGQALIGFGAGDSLLAVTTPSFDISAVELLMPLIAGGVVDVAPEDAVGDGIRLAELIASRKPAFLQATPTTWKALLATGWKGDDRLIMCAAGESLSRDLAEKLLPRGRALWNLYGPTETTVWSTACRVTSAPDAPVSIGRPLANTQLYVLDGQREPVPIGVVGELYIGGIGLAAGYWQRPDLTAERFVAHPFRPGARLYRTGDLARYRADGTLLCLGRVDDQTKIHGVRVELGEVEAALRSVPGIRDAVVTTWRDPQGDAQLVAHVIPTAHTPLSASEIRTHLRAQLPEAVIPPSILFAEAFPMTANGKIRRAGLPPPHAVARTPGVGRSIEPLATPTERALADAWARVIGIDVAIVGRESNFMDLGGHSLLMTPLMIEVRRQFGVSVSLREFFDAPTIRTFGQLIDDRRTTPPASARERGQSPAIRRRDWGRERMATLEREAHLPPNIAPVRGLTYQAVAKIGSVLMTGATGFLGAYLLAEILETTDADVYCLVRTRLGQDGRDRIEKQMRAFAVWRDGERWRSAWRERVHVVEGDVTLPRLGMADGTYETLARTVDAIIHGAAHVNFIYPYEALRATNVQGLHEVIRFAFHARVKPVHHLSTAAIWPMGSQFTFYEKDSIEHGQLLNLGYDEAKWVGERCLLHAADRGLPVARYRPGEVGGDSVTGRCVTEHFLVASIKGFLQVGVFPALDIEIDVAPVDYVAKAMTHLVFRRDPIGRAFHLTNPNRLHMRDALAFLRLEGYVFDELPFERLRDRLLSGPDFGANALFAYQAVLEDMDDVSLQLPTYDTREVERELRDSGIACARADERLFGLYLDYLRNIGFMPLPAHLPAPI